MGDSEHKELYDRIGELEQSRAAAEARDTEREKRRDERHSEVMGLLEGLQESIAGNGKPGLAKRVDDLERTRKIALGALVVAIPAFLKMGWDLVRIWFAQKIGG